MFDPWTEDLLRLLQQLEGGVQINLSRSGVAMSTRTTPGVQARGKSVDATARKLAHELREAAARFETWYGDRDGWGEQQDAMHALGEELDLLLAREESSSDE